MPAIPEFLLRKLYVPESLQPCEGGYSFELNNSLAPVTLTGLSIVVDNQPCDPGNVFLLLPTIGEISTGGISSDHPFNLGINMTVHVRVFGVLPRQRLVIRVDTRDVGVLQFGVPITIAEDPVPVIKQKSNLFSKMNRRFRYAAQVFKVQQDAQHPVYHYSPPANWMNDPVGLIYWKGKYHLFFQYNPFEPTWGNIHWGHASSKDMVHWQHLPIALWPDENGADAGGCYSGCAINNEGTPVFFYTGVFPEAQLIATGETDDLLVLKKHPNPVIPTAPQGMLLEGFRDPCVWKESSEWRMILGSGLTDVGGAVLIYRSKNLLEWQYLGLLFHGETSQDGTLCTGRMWECPSFFPLDDKWILIVSACGSDGALHSLYYVGNYQVDRFIPEGPPQLVDGGAGPCFYAPQTFVEKKGKRVMIGWLREARSSEEQTTAGWSGTMSLPRYLSLSKDGKLWSTPSEEVKLLRREHETITKANPFSNLVRGQYLEMFIRIPPDAEKWSGIHLTTGASGEDDILIGVDSLHSAVVVDCRHAGGVISVVPVELPDLDELELHVFIDGSVIEVYVEDKYPISARFYIKKPQAIRVRQVGESTAELWRLKY